jgi:hypothetical protein
VTITSGSRATTSSGSWCSRSSRGAGASSSSAALLGRFGPFIRDILDRHFYKVAAAFIVAIVGGFVAFRYMF